MSCAVDIGKNGPTGFFKVCIKIIKLFFLYLVVPCYDF